MKFMPDSPTPKSAYASSHVENVGEFAVVLNFQGREIPAWGESPNGALTAYEIAEKLFTHGRNRP
jgi:hypothetical protein